VRTPNAVVSLGIKFVGEKSPPLWSSLNLYTYRTSSSVRGWKCETFTHRHSFWV
jgi:hypothetical protein